MIKLFENDVKIWLFNKARNYMQRSDVISVKTFLWIEDQKDKAAYTFWKSMMQQLYPEVVVESKMNNSELVKAVQKLSDWQNKYIIVFDNSFDNLQAIMEQRRLREAVATRANVILFDIICFEYILLEFRNLIDWIYAPNDEFLEKRHQAVLAREKLLYCVTSGTADYKTLNEIVAYDERVAEHNIEKLSAKLLFDLTRNTGFEVTKGSLGECWLLSCCEWTKREDNDICGLDYRRLSIYDKMKSVYENTCLQKQFQIAGLEIAL